MSANADPNAPPTTPSTAPPPPSTPVRRRQGHAVLYVIIAIVIVVILVGVGAATSWYGLQKKSSTTTAAACTTGVTLLGNGASFLSSLMSQWESSYNAATGNTVDYTAGSAGAGILALSEKTVDFAATDEPLNASDVTSMPGQLLTLPITGGAVTIVYNIPGFSGTLDLTGNQLAGIYTGTITNWNSPALATDNSGLPSGTIVTVHRSDPAGTSYVLTNLLSLDNASWKATIGTSISPAWPKAPTQEAEKGNSGLAKYIAATSDTIGYVDLADAQSNKLAIAGVQNPAGHFVVPTVANTQAAINNLSGQSIPAATGNWSAVSWVNSPGSYDYPLATLSYFLILQDPALGLPGTLADAQVLIQWITWSVDHGQGYAAGLDYVSPPANLLSQDLSALGTMNWNGASIPACT